jgi:hypothetical protein
VHHLGKKPLTLVAKLAEACNAVGGVEKRGRNDFHKYSYVKAADVAKAIRHELFQRGVIIVPNETEFIETGKIKTNSGGEMREFRLTVEFTIYDGTSEDKITVKAFGVAADTGDKTLYKCKTGATKYFLRALGLIPDEKDDPEFDEAVDEKTDPRATHATPGESKSARKKRERIKEYQARGWDSAVRESGKTAQQVATFLQTRYSATSITELSPDEFNDAIKWAVGTESLEKTLEASVKAAKAGRKQPIVDVLDHQPSDEFDEHMAGG